MKMTDKYKYKSISLKTQTIEMIEKLSESLVAGKKLSNAGTVQILVNNSFESKNAQPNNMCNDSNKNTGIIPRG
jgi:hypothetical protein